MLTAILILCGCGRDGRKTETQDQADNFNVEYLFTKDGCKMYRFSDFNMVYLMTCKNTSTQYETTCGKGCVKKVQQVTK